jgi:Cu+-exporting ATPase
MSDPIPSSLSVEGLSCASSVGRVDRALVAVPGVLEANVNLAAETATVTYATGAVTRAQLVATSTRAGYPARLAEATESQDRSTRKAEEARALSRRMGFAAALALPVFIVEMGGHVFPVFHHLINVTIGQQMSWVLQFILTTIVLARPGRVFYTKGIPALLKGAPDMNSLVAVGTGAAYVYSVVAAFLPGLLPDVLRAVYFEAAAVIVVLILLGRFLEAHAKGRTGVAVEKLLGLQAKTARVLRGGETVEIRVEELAQDDIVLIRPGERIAVYGEVTEGSSRVNESMLTGEPVPTAKAMGDSVMGGTVNGTGSMQVRAGRVGQDSTLAQIISMVEEAQGAKLPIQGLVDRITMWFVPAVMSMSVLTVLVWLVTGPQPALIMALVAGVSVLIIACPCAMGLATPTSIMVGTGRAAELGVLFRKGDALQALDGVQIVALDKTGTVTEGRPELTALVLAPGFDRAGVLSVVAAVEAQSEHPIAEAIVRAAEAEGMSLPGIAEFTSVTGYGVRAEVKGREVLIGADRFMTREGIDVRALTEIEAELANTGRTALFAAIGGQVAAVIGVADPVKPASRAAIDALRAKGLTVAMITGDKQATADVIACETGIDHVVAGVLPDGKVAALEALRAVGKSVAFVGDGINNAPALAYADVGIAIGTGTDVAIESADVILMSGDLRGVVNAVEVSTRTIRNIRENLFWAFAYNTALVLVAPGAMALSSVFVMTNALRLRRVSPAMSEISTDIKMGAATVAAPAE